MITAICRCKLRLTRRSARDLGRLAVFDHAVQPGLPGVAHTPHIAVGQIAGVSIDEKIEIGLRSSQATAAQETTTHGTITYQVDPTRINQGHATT